MAGQNPHLSIAALQIGRMHYSPLSVIDPILGQEGFWSGVSSVRLENLSNEAFATALFRNTFGSTPAAAELQPWVQYLGV